MFTCNIALTIFNAAPGQAGLEDEFYKKTDILCVNETEVIGLMDGCEIVIIFTITSFNNALMKYSK